MVTGSLQEGSGYSQEPGGVGMVQAVLAGGPIQRGWQLRQEVWGSTGADKDRNGREACKCMECKFYGTQGPSGLRTWQMGLMKGGQLSEGQQ